jgi:hypothetical protein
VKSIELPAGSKEAPHTDTFVLYIGKFVIQTSHKNCLFKLYKHFIMPINRHIDKLKNTHHWYNKISEIKIIPKEAPNHMKRHIIAEEKPNNEIDIRHQRT